MPQSRKINIDFSIGTPRIFVWGGREAVMKIMSKSSSRHLVRLQGKLKLTEKEKDLDIRKFLLYFPIFQWTSHQLISVADLGLSLNHTKPLISLNLQNLCVFFKFCLGEGGLRTSSPHILGAPMDVSESVSCLVLQSTKVSPLQKLHIFQTFINIQTLRILCCHLAS